MPKSWLILYEWWSTRALDHFEPKIAAIWDNFLTSPNCTFEGLFGFLVKNDVNHAQIKANIVWIVMYACPRSFWAQNRRDWRRFLDGPKLAPRLALLGFWPKSMQIMPKSRLILYESWSTRARDQFEPKIAAIGENILKGPNWHLRGPSLVFGQKRCK